jgi:predicted TPR repeat methyltransferase
VGFGAGELARRIRGHCAYLAGIELDTEAAHLSAHIFDRCIAQDLLTSLKELDEEPFDVVVAGDVLEHLPDPGTVLDLLHPLVKPEGCFLASIPNVANVTLRLSLLLGRFDYASRGILDASHLRFFTKRTGRVLLESHGFHVVGTTATAMPAELALPALGKAPFSPFVQGTALALARVWPTLFGYQFVFEAIPA